MSTKSDKGLAIGIDLGTTYSCLGIYRFGKVETIANNFGNHITPSMVGFDEDERLIGEAAQLQQNTNPDNTIYDAKRLIGRNFIDPEIQDDILHWPFHVIDNGDGKPKYEVTYQGHKRFFSPEGISALILIKMKQTAEDFLGTPVDNAVITVPAYFNDFQRKATKNAAELAGLNVLRLINEPTAAALAYGLCNDKGGDKNVMVYDLGGGTFDISILTIRNKCFSVKATGGNTHLGGEDFNQRMVNYLIDEIQNKHQHFVGQNKKALGKLHRACEQAKRTLSLQSVAKINIESLFDGVDFKSTISSSLFDELNADLFEETMAKVKSTLKDAKMSKFDIDKIVLVGGSTRIPRIQKLVKDFFGKEPVKSINPEEAIAQGACIAAAILNGDDSIEIIRTVLEDVTPLSLGIKVVGEKMSFQIKRNTTLPATCTHRYSTAQHFQTAIRIYVFQGESTHVRNNLLLGEFRLCGVPSDKKGKEKVNVTFDIDENGILKVSAILISTQAKMHITVDTKGKLTKKEIESMVLQAEVDNLELAKQEAEMAELKKEIKLVPKKELLPPVDKLSRSRKSSMKSNKSNKS